MTPEAALVAALRSGLAAASNPARAPAMQAYMKSALPFRGVRSHERSVIERRILALHPLPDAASWRDAVFELWHGADYREERYSALAVLGAPAYRAHRTLDVLPVYEELIVTGAWWDLVDGIATHQLRELLENHPSELRGIVRRWAEDRNLWMRRSAIICQAGRGRATDQRLLFDSIQPNLADPAFFIRKAIGWALREYARAAPDAVRRYLAANQSRLSGLSRREAARNLSA